MRQLLSCGLGNHIFYDAIKFFNLSNSLLLFVKNKLLNTLLTAFANEENVTLGVWFFFIKLDFVVNVFLIQSYLGCHF